MKELSSKEYISYRKGDPPLDDAKRNKYLDLIPGWEIVDREGSPRLERHFSFPDFKGALEFTNQVGSIAEEVDHHPAILLTWGRVVVSWWTHVIQDLHENDFIMAARTDELYSKLG